MRACLPLLRRSFALASVSASCWAFQRSYAKENEARLILMGTGTSEGVPRVSCLIFEKSKCEVCPNALTPKSKNRRRNTGALLVFDPPGAAPGAEKKIISIDCGKFWWEAAMAAFPANDLHHLDGVIITHDHHDAIGGIDDLRDFTRHTNKPLKVYLNKTTMARVAGAFPYLVDRSKVTGGGLIANLEFIVFENGVPFEVEGLKVTPFPLTHGTCIDFSAFRIGSLCWMSDVSVIPDTSRKHIEGASTIILDYLEDADSHPSHFCRPDVLREVKHDFRAASSPPPPSPPKKDVWLVGMSHRVDHEKANEFFRAQGLANVQCGFDGQRMTIRI